MAIEQWKQLVRVLDVVVPSDEEEQPKKAKKAKKGTKRKSEAAADDHDDEADGKAPKKKQKTDKVKKVKKDKKTKKARPSAEVLRVLKKPRQFGRDWIATAGQLSKEASALLKSKALPVGQLLTGDAKKPVYIDVVGGAVWKGPYDVSTEGDARRVSRHWERTRAFQAWGIGVPHLDVLYEDAHDKTKVWMRFELLVSDKVKNDVKIETSKRETKGVEYTILSRECLGVQQLNQVDPSEFGRNADFLAQFVLSFVARYIVQPRYGSLVFPTLTVFPVLGASRPKKLRRCGDMELPRRRWHNLQLGHGR